MDKENPLRIEDWKDLHTRIGDFDEEQLRLAINYEMSTFNRKGILSRLHMRFTKLNNKRVREQLLNGEIML